MDMEVAFLKRPGRGNNTRDAFYIAVIDDRAPFTIHGTNSPRTRGTITACKSAADVKKKVQNKVTGQYRKVDPGAIANAPRATLLKKLREMLNIDENVAIQINAGTITVGNTANGYPGPRKHPRSRKRGSAPKISDLWF